MRTTKVTTIALLILCTGKLKRMTMKTGTYLSSCTHLVNYIHVYQLPYLDCNSFSEIHYSSIWGQIWPCHIEGQDQPRIIIRTSFVALESYCFIPSFKIIGLLIKKIFDRFLPYRGMAATLVMWPSSFEQTFIHPIQRGSASSLALIGPAASEQKMFKRWISVNLRQRSNNYLDLCFQEHVCRLYVHIKRANLTLP